MADGEMRNLTQIIDELYETRISSASRYIPTRAELNRYLRSENYSATTSKGTTTETSL